MKTRKPLMIRFVCLAACGLFALAVAQQIWVFVGPYEDEEAMRKFDEWGVPYGRHAVNSPIPYWGGNVHNATLAGEVDREVMDTLVSLKHPKVVFFLGCTFTERGLLPRVAEMRTLRGVGFCHGVVTDDDLVELLPRLTTIQYLYLQDNPITDRCVEAIASMPKLRAVCIFGTSITDGGKARLRSLRPELDVDDVLQ
jgi:hypothetical protein